MNTSVKDKKFYNFMINTSNQANLTNIENTSAMQMNSIFVFISPYVLEKVNIEGLDIDIRVDDKGLVHINNTQFEPVEITSGVSVLGILKR
ncbi:MAG: hypothetical protein ACOYWZ_14775 [Bacillota bacterium]